MLRITDTVQTTHFVHPAAELSILLLSPSIGFVHPACWDLNITWKSASSHKPRGARGDGYQLKKKIKYGQGLNLHSIYFTVRNIVFRFKPEKFVSFGKSEFIWTDTPDLLK